MPAFDSKVYVLGDARSHIHRNAKPLLSNRQKIFLVGSKGLRTYYELTYMLYQISDIAKALAFSMYFALFSSYLLTMHWPYKVHTKCGVAHRDVKGVRASTTLHPTANALPLFIVKHTSRSQGEPSFRRSRRLWSRQRVHV